MPANTDYNLALLIAIGVCWLGVRCYRWWAAGGRFASPDPAHTHPKGITAQISREVTPHVTPLPGSAGEDVAGRRTARIDRWVASQPPGTRTSELIRRAHSQLGVSSATVKRALRRHRRGEL